MSEEEIKHVVVKNSWKEIIKVETLSLLDIMKEQSNEKNTIPKNDITPPSTKENKKKGLQFLRPS